MHAALRKKIRERTARLGFVGLGYVGLPVGLSFAAKGFAVRAHDIDANRVAAIERAELPFGTGEPGLVELFESVAGTRRFAVSSDAEVLAGCDIFFLAIDTPVGSGYAFDAGRFLGGLNKISAQLKRGGMVVVESTVPPGTMNDLVITQLEVRSGLLAGRDFLVVHCPERLRPGRLLHNLTQLGRLVGGDSEETSEVGRLLYGEIVQGALTGVDYRTAEVVKTAENAARDVQIALANQLAVVCDVVGVDFRVVRQAVNEVWDSEPLVLEAGPGVGGHCLPKDPWLLASPLPNAEMRALIAGARGMNSFMPAHVAALANAMLLDEGIRMADATIAILGVAYAANSDDTRNSPGLAVAERLRAAGAEIRIHDPFVPQYAGDLTEILRGTDLAVVIDGHAPYRHLDFAAVRLVMRTPAILDTRRCLDSQLVADAGLRYSALGVGALTRRPS